MARACSQEILQANHVAAAAAVAADSGAYTTAAHIASPANPDWATATEPLPVEYGGYTYNSEIVFRPHAGRRPIVLVFPNYCGKKQFDVDQAAFLAQCGYTAVAVEERKDHSYERNPGPRDGMDVLRTHVEKSFDAMNTLRADVHTMRGIAHATLAAARAHRAAHASHAAAIGYCFGGQFLFEAVRGGVDLDAVVSFHGLLQTFPSDRGDPNTPRWDLYPQQPSAPAAHATKCRVLIENGDLDEHVPVAAVEAFREEFDGAGVEWRMHNHSATDHGFALPKTLISGSKFDTDADRRSTLSMLSLFCEAWPAFPPNAVPRNAAGTVLGQSVHVARL